MLLEPEPPPLELLPLSVSSTGLEMQQPAGLFEEDMFWECGVDVGLLVIVGYVDVEDVGGGYVGMSVYGRGGAVG